MTAPALDQLPVLDDDVVKRLHALRAQVQRPGEDLLGELITLFERDSTPRLAVLRSDCSDDDRRRAAHALKGSAANLGAKRVAALALHLEKNPGTSADRDRLEAEVAAALAALRAAL